MKSKGANKFHDMLGIPAHKPIPMRMLLETMKARPATTAKRMAAVRKAS